MIKILQIIILVVFSLLMMSSSCDKGAEGCTDSTACNYDAACADALNPTCTEIDDTLCWYVTDDACTCDDGEGAFYRTIWSTTTHNRLGLFGGRDATTPYHPELPRHPRWHHSGRRIARYRDPRGMGIRLRATGTLLRDRG